MKLKIQHAKIGRIFYSAILKDNTKVNDYSSLLLSSENTLKNANSCPKF